VWWLARSPKVLGVHRSDRLSQVGLLAAAAASTALPVLLLIAR